MRSRDRVGKVYAKLTARERVLAMLAAYKAGKRADPRILSTLPPEQGRAFNAYVDRLERLDREGRGWVLALARGIDELDTLAGWLMTVRLVAASLDAFEDGRAAGVRRRARTTDARDTALATLQRRLACCAFPDEDGASDAEEPRSLLPILQDRFRREVQDRWAELRAVEIEVADLGAALDCPDVLMPDLRELLEDCRRRLQALAADTRYCGKRVPLPEPEEGYLALVAKVFRPDQPR